MADAATEAGKLAVQVGGLGAGAAIAITGAPAAAAIIAATGGAAAVVLVGLGLYNWLSSTPKEPKP